ncbi:hypothetical protein W03_10330 [Nitrosomonas sp. PY1]|uniref:hypothetical protein n=1 Tax=Nitrosomonas sp. PY1 TaxID=1803906 RepID=UPI001FC7E9D2|nr:hypothetical protein [Nitrosomonas sp. PY1]GKS69029.1 hypothetical protein W03_10330 [Nitrosomonas sp. PY1]
MKDQLTTRLEALKQEYATGQKMLADAEMKRAELQSTLLRISGAIQVLEEMLSQDKSPEEGNKRELMEAD